MGTQRYHILKHFILGLIAFTVFKSLWRQYLQLCNFTQTDLFGLLANISTFTVLQVHVYRAVARRKLLPGNAGKKKHLFNNIYHFPMYSVLQEPQNMQLGSCKTREPVYISRKIHTITWKKINTVNSTDFYQGKCLGSPNASYDPVFDFGMRANLNWRSKEICLLPKTEYIVFLVLRKINQKKTRAFNYNLLLFSDGAVK